MPLALGWLVTQLELSRTPRGAMWWTPDGLSAALPGHLTLWVSRIFRQHGPVGTHYISGPPPPSPRCQMTAQPSAQATPGIPGVPFDPSLYLTVQCRLSPATCHLASLCGAPTPPRALCCICADAREQDFLVLLAGSYSQANHSLQVALTLIS